MASVALAACAAPTAQWEKPGTSAAATQEAHEQCRASALLEAREPYLWGPQTTTTTRVLTVEEQRELNQIEAFQKCMQGKGYATKR